MGEASFLHTYLVHGGAVKVCNPCLFSKPLDDLVSSMAECFYMAFAKQGIISFFFFFECSNQMILIVGGKNLTQLTLDCQVLEGRALVLPLWGSQLATDSSIHQCSWLPDGQTGCWVTNPHLIGREGRGCISTLLCSMQAPSMNHQHQLSWN